MQVTLTATGIMDTLAIDGAAASPRIPARIWEGVTDQGVPVKAWIAVIQPQTDDPALLAAFAAELRAVPASRHLVSFDLRLVL